MRPGRAAPRRWLAPLLLAALLGALAFGLAGFGALPAGRLARLAGIHAGLALAGVVPAALLGLLLGVAVTREVGRPLRPAADTLAAAAQAVPPVVVVALAVPAMGFGWGPVVLALLLYGLMPVLRATVAALEAVPPDALLAARALGYTAYGRFREVEAPLAFPLVLDGLRVALVLGVATAAVGALAGAATLGTPIVLGLQNQNQLLVLQGAAATAALAFAAEGVLLALASSARLTLDDPVAPVASTVLARSESPGAFSSQVEPSDDLENTTKQQARGVGVNAGERKPL